MLGVDRGAHRGAPEAALALGAVDPVQLDDLVPRRRGRRRSDRPARDAEPLGEERDDRVVGAAALGRRRDAHLPAVAVAADDLASARTRETTRSRRRVEGSMRPSIGTRCRRLRQPRASDGVLVPRRARPRAAPAPCAPRPRAARARRAAARVTARASACASSTIRSASCCACVPQLVRRIAPPRRASCAAASRARGAARARPRGARPCRRGRRARARRSRRLSAISSISWSAGRAPVAEQPAVERDVAELDR